jgi:hypothetical protein
MMRRLLRMSLIPALVALSACAPVPGANDVARVGETGAGRPVYSVEATSASAFGWPPFPQSTVDAKARGTCPGGYVELAREVDAQRRISGVFYIDVTMRFVCV